MKQLIAEAWKVAGNLTETAPHVIESINAVQGVDRPTAWHSFAIHPTDLWSPLTLQYNS